MTFLTKHLVPILILAFALFPSCFDAWAISALPEPIKVTQKDGSKLTICLYGDEKGFTVMTPDSLPVVVNDEGIYEYADPKNTSKCSGIRVSNMDCRSIAERNWIASSGIRYSQPYFIQSARAIAPLERKLRYSSEGSAKVKITNYPTLGRHKALVVLVEFEDKEFSTMENAWDYYDGLLNEPGFSYRNGADGSARDFYLYSSAGLYDPEFIVIGPVKLPGSVAFYGDDSSTTLDENAWQMIVDACNAIDDQIDFSEFDADGDGVVDSIYFFYAGFGEADSGIRNSIWPHSGLLKDNWGVDLKLDGMTINNYACSNEIRSNSGPLYVPVGIGTFVHEFGHVLGIADHYDTRSSSGRPGVEQWDTMGAASYNNNQNTPPAFSAFERAELGWLELTEIAPSEEGVLTLPVLSPDNPEAFVVRVPDDKVDEYFILERRNKTGWDSTLPAQGMLVWHVDMVDELWWNNEVNIDPVHQHLDIVEADNTENITSFSGDVFPGRENVTEFVFNSWSGEDLFSFDHVVELPMETLVILSGTNFTPPSPAVSVSDIHGRSFAIECPSDPQILEYELSIYDASGNVLEDYSAIRFDNDLSTEAVGLEPQSQYRVEVVGIAGSYRSLEAVVDVTTKALEFFEKSPANLGVCHIGEGKFKVSWDALDEADDYEVTLLRQEFSDPVVDACSFDDGFNDMPHGWSTNSAKLSRPVFGEKSPALRFDSDGDWLEFSYSGCELLSLQFYQFSQTDSNVLLIEGFDSDAKTIFEQSVPASTEGVLVNVDFPFSTECVRVSFIKSGGYMVIDDVEVTVRFLEDSPCDPYFAISSDGQTNFILEGLEPDVQYGVEVVARKESSLSLTSEVFRFIPSDMITGVGGLAEEDNREQWFDLSGRRVASHSVSAGVYIVRKRHESKKMIVN